MSKECSSKHPEDLFPVKQNPRRPPHQNQPSTKISRTRSKQTKQFSLQHSSLRTRLQQRLPCSEPASSCSASPLSRAGPRRAEPRPPPFPPLLLKGEVSAAASREGPGPTKPSRAPTPASPARPALLRSHSPPPAQGRDRGARTPHSPPRAAQPRAKSRPQLAAPPQPVTFQVPSPRMGILAPVFSCT